MIPTISENTAELDSICRERGVLRLELFGSATSEHRFTQDSDLDFLVEFHELPEGGYADAYFGLMEDLEHLFRRPIDLVVDSAIKNPYFRQSVNRTRQLLYGD